MCVRIYMDTNIRRRLMRSFAQFPQVIYIYIYMHACMCVYTWRIQKFEETHAFVCIISSGIKHTHTHICMHLRAYIHGCTRLKKTHEFVCIIP